MKAHRRRRGYKWAANAALLAALVFSGSAQAARMQALAWGESTAKKPVIAMNFDEIPPFSSQSSPNGRRIRITFPGADIAKQVEDLSGVGGVKGVFPYVSEDGRDLFVDILLKEPGRLDISSAGNVLKVAVVTNSAVAAPSSSMPEKKPALAPKMAAPAAATGAVVAKPGPAAKPKRVAPVAHATSGDMTHRARRVTPAVASTPAFIAHSSAASALNAIRDVQFSKLSGSRVLVKISLAGPASAPGNFATNDPPRLILDFAGTTNKTGKSVLPVNLGVLDSIHMAEGGGRTRMVLNLLKPVQVDPEVVGNDVFITLDSSIGSVATKKTEHFSYQKEAGDNLIKSVDFRRDKNGAGKVLIGLSNPSARIDVHEGVGEIIVDIAGGHMPAKLERSLDVMDFATPVQYVESMNQGKNARIVLKAAGKYEQMAYQTGDTFSITVTPLTPEQLEKQKTDEFGYKGEKLSLNFQNIDVRAALQVIADFTGINFVTADTVKGELTLRLKDVPWDQALDMILKAKGLAKREKGNVIWVAPAEEIADQETKELEAQKKVAELEPLQNELIQINYAKAKDIADILKSIKAVKNSETEAIRRPLFGVSATNATVTTQTDSNTLLSERGQVTVDERTNSVLVQDTRAKIEAVKKLIAKLDRPVRQVLVETRIVEATDDFAKQLGARIGSATYAQNPRVSGDSPNSLGSAGFGGSSLPSIDYTWDKYYDKTDPTISVQSATDGAQPNWYNVDLSADAIGTSQPGRFAYEVWTFGDTFWKLIGLEISALEAEGKGKIIASPRLLAADNEEAHIEQGQERVFVVFGDIVTKKAVLGLTVTPQITPDERVILDVNITKDNFASAVDPIIDTRQIKTNVLLDNGETVVIGGIYQEEKLHNVDKIPVLGDIPVLGQLFRKKTDNNSKTELLIFLTPKILTPALNIH